MNPRAQAIQQLIEEQLVSIPDIRFKRMFGGFGIYAGDVFFGIIHGECLYFKTNEATRARYEEAGMGCFITPGKKMALKAYYEVPLDVLESRPNLLEWARESIRASS